MVSGLRDHVPDVWRHIFVPWTKEVQGVRQLLPMFNGCDAKAMAFELHVKAYSYHVRPKETTLLSSESIRGRWRDSLRLEQSDFRARLDSFLKYQV